MGVVFGLLWNGGVLRPNVATLKGVAFENSRTITKRHGSDVWAQACASVFVRTTGADPQTRGVCQNREPKKTTEPVRNTIREYKNWRSCGFSERMVYGNSLAGLLRVKTIPGSAVQENMGRKYLHRECPYVHKKLGLFLSVYVCEIVLFLEPRITKQSV